ncbi:MAG: PAS domain S-box protein [Candidatus Eisenbacteria bacterium]|nr:PAS domain S-box protein [Candidatus Eisenbacteria bacterium]
MPRAIADKYLTILDCIDEVVYIVDVPEGDPFKGHVRWVSSRVESILGYRPEEFYADPGLWPRLLHPDDVQALGATTRTILESGTPGLREYRLRHRQTGEYRWIEDRVVPKLEGGRVVGIHGAARDVTDRKRREEACHNLALAVEQTADAVLIAGRDGVIKYVNPAFETLTGHSRGEVVGRTPRLLKSGTHDAEFYRHLWETILAGRVFRGVLTNRKRNGETYLEQKTITPIRDPGGAITHFVSTGKDITESRRLEQQLMQSQKMDAIGQLAGGVAHDFNNLLTVIVGCGELLRRGLEPGGRPAGQAETILAAAERAAELTRQLLAFSRRQPQELRVLDLNAVASGMTGILRRLIGTQIELVEDLGSPLGGVRADASQLEQVLLNLVVNARDSMPDGGTLTIRTAEVELAEAEARRHPGMRPGACVLLEVTDTGTGMDAPTQARIFEPFFSTKEQGRGTGLGLSTVYGIVKQSEGYIGVESEVGRGTTFRVFLPRVEAAVERLGRPETSRPAPEGGTETILLVEDEPMVLDFTALALRDLGYTVLEAASGEEALRLLEQGGAREVHLLLTDVIMPRMSGHVLADRVRALRPGIRVLLVSGYAGEAPGAPGGPGAAPLLQKPFTATTLAQKVRGTLDAG